MGKSFEIQTRDASDTVKRAAGALLQDVQIAHAILYDTHAELARDASAVVALARELGEERRRLKGP